VTLTFAAWLLLFGVGFSLGAVGSGGSIFMLPVLVYLQGVPTPQAVAITLVSIGGCSLLGAILRARRGLLHWRAVWMMGPTGMAGALIGAQFTHLVGDHVLRLLFAGTMLLVGATMVRQRGVPAHGQGCQLRRCTPVGFGVGLLTGFLGLGGGFLIMPSLVYFGGLEVRRAVGAALAIIALNASAGVVGHLLRTSLDWRLTTATLVATMTGLVVGSLLCERVPDRVLNRVLAWLILIVAAGVLLSETVGRLRA
jgi:uncharacterized protein